MTGQASQQVPPRCQFPANTDRREPKLHLDQQNTVSACRLVLDRDHRVDCSIWPGPYLTTRVVGGRLEASAKQLPESFQPDFEELLFAFGSQGHTAGHYGKLVLQGELARLFDLPRSGKLVPRVT